MVAFEVFLNGERLALAGAEDLCVLSTFVTAAGVLGKASRGTQSVKHGYELSLHVGGTSGYRDKETGGHLDWCRQKDLEVGDEVVIRLVEAIRADTPQQRRADTGCGVRRLDRHGENG